MPLGDAIAFMLQPVAEVALQLVGYYTSRVVVPVLSCGRAYVEPAPKGVIVHPRWHGFHRDSDGKVVVDAEMGSFLGLAFWMLVAVLIGLIAFVFSTPAAPLTELRN